MFFYKYNVYKHTELAFWQKFKHKLSISLASLRFTLSTKDSLWIKWNWLQL